MVNLEKTFAVMKRIHAVYNSSSKWNYNDLMGAYAETLAISEIRNPRYEKNEIIRYFLDDIVLYKWKIEEILSYPSTNEFSIYNHGAPKTRSRDGVHVSKYFDFEYYIKNVMSFDIEPAQWLEVDDKEGVFNKHFIGVLREIDDSFNETELLSYKANFDEIKELKKGYNFQQRENP